MPPSSVVMWLNLSVWSKMRLIISSTEDKYLGFNFSKIESFNCFKFFASTMPRLIQANKESAEFSSLVADNTVKMSSVSLTHLFTNGGHREILNRLVPNRLIFQWSDTGLTEKIPKCNDSFPSSAEDKFKIISGSLRLMNSLFGADHKSSSFTKIKF